MSKKKRETNNAWIWAAIAAALLAASQSAPTILNACGACGK